MLEVAQQTLLGAQCDDSFISFNTSFSYKVVRKWRGLVKMTLKVCAKKPKHRFDFLLAWTKAIDSYDCWKHDHEDGYAEEYGGGEMLSEMGKIWKALLKKTDAELGIDAEFTRPGIEYFLQKFKASIENADDVLASYFKFE